MDGEGQRRAVSSLIKRRRAIKGHNYKNLDERGAQQRFGTADEAQIAPLGSDGRLRKSVLSRSYGLATISTFGQLTVVAPLSSGAAQPHHQGRIKRQRPKGTWALSTRNLTSTRPRVICHMFASVDDAPKPVMARGRRQGRAVRDPARTVWRPHLASKTRRLPHRARRPRQDRLLTVTDRRRSEDVMIHQTRVRFDLMGWSQPPLFRCGLWGLGFIRKMAPLPDRDEGCGGAHHCHFGN